MRATAAVLHAPGAELVLEEVEVDAPREGEVLVELRATGVCHTDLGAIDGHVSLPFPVVLGHEGAGVVVESRAPGLVAGDHVVLSFDSCGSCSVCSRGRPAYCSSFHALNHSGLRADGSRTLGTVHGSFLGQSSFATQALASGRNAVKIDEGAGFVDVAALGCSVQTGAGAVLNVLRPEPGSSLAVFGCGAVGLSAVMAAVALGCSVVAVDPMPERVALAESLGAVAGEPRRMDYSVEAVGTEAAITAALRCLRSPGACATLGYRGPRNPVTIDQGRLLFGRSLHGVIEGDADPLSFIPSLIGRGITAADFSTPYAFQDINCALKAAREGAAIKPVLTFDDFHLSGG